MRDASSNFSSLVNLPAATYLNNNCLTASNNCTTATYTSANSLTGLASSGSII